MHPAAIVSELARPESTSTGRPSNARLTGRRFCGRALIEGDRQALGELPLGGALVPAGRLEAQCGGGPNLARLRACVATLIENEPYAVHFEGCASSGSSPIPARPPAARKRRFRRYPGDPRTGADPIRFRGHFSPLSRKHRAWPHLERLPDSPRGPFLDSFDRR